MTAARARDEVAPALTLAIAVLGVSWAGAILGWRALGLSGGRDLQGTADRMLLLHLAQVAAFAAAAALVAVGGLELARARRSPGAFVVAAAGAALVGWLGLGMVAMWTWPFPGAGRGWRAQVLAIDPWLRLGALLAITGGLIAAGWADRVVRVLAAPALGAAGLAIPPPPLHRLVLGWLEPPVTVGPLPPEWRFWVGPGLLALGGLSWAAVTTVIVRAQPRGPVRVLEPAAVARAARRLGVAIVILAAVAIAAGVILAVVQKRPTRWAAELGLMIPVAVGAATVALGAALLGLAWVEVATGARRRLAVAALCVLWLVGVVAGQTVWSQGVPRPPVLIVFHSPWMSPLVAAAVAIVALIATWSALADLGTRVGLPRRRGHTVVVALAVALGALTAPWVLGFGRSFALDTVRVVTLATAAVVNLGAFVAVARAAFQVARALRS